VLIILVLSLFAVHRPTTQAQPDGGIYKYAYTTKQKGNVSIKLVDPINIGGSPINLSVPAPDSYIVAQGYASPSAQWIALLFDIEGFPDKGIKLINTSSSEVRALPEFFDLPEATGVSVPEQIVSWSPDSQFVSFRGKLPDTQGNSDIYLYSLATGNTVNLTHDDATQYRFVWSKNSQKIAAFSERCPAKCQPTIDIFDVSTASRQSSTDLTPLLSPVSELNTPSRANLCRFEWSPDGLHISFVMGCGAEDVYFAEVYRLTLSSNTLNAVTAFTTPPAQLGGTQAPASEFTSEYTPFWYNAATLLTGIYVHEHALDQVVNVVQQTSAYNVSGGNPTNLNTTMTEEWVLNPTTGELGLRSYNFDAQGQIQNASIQIATLNGQALTVSRTAPDGCNLKWSPDGTILSYNTASGTPKRCRAETSTSGLNFLNRATGQIASYTSIGQYAIAFGWVSISGSTPTPTPQQGTLKLQYYPDPTARGVTVDAIIPDFNIVNTGSTAVPLSELKIRYYFTRDSAPQDIIFHCDFTELPGGCGSITGQVVTLPTPVTGADSYIEIGFTSGTLAANSQTQDILVDVVKFDASNFTQTNDYSFEDRDPAFTDWSKVTLYRNGTLVWGTPPN
jgi:hypothetical protein